MQPCMQKKLERLVAIAATVAAIVLGGAVLAFLTRGLTSFTSESWRRASIAAHPRPVPDVTLQDHTGALVQTASLCGRVMVIDFVYTQCPTVCKSIGTESAWLARQLADLIDSEQAIVLSVSFDQMRDTPDALAQFRRNLSGIQSTPWRLARPVSKEDQQALLEAFDVVVIPDGYGGFDHNAALHLVDRNCRLSRVVDLEEVRAVPQWVRAAAHVSG